MYVLFNSRSLRQMPYILILLFPPPPTLSSPLPKHQIITTGNHELYNYTISLSTQQNIATHYGENYVTSNVEVTLPSGKTVGLGQRYRRFTTLMGKKGVALGPLFDFKGMFFFFWHWAWVCLSPFVGLLFLH